MITMYCICVCVRLIESFEIITSTHIDIIICVEKCVGQRLYSFKRDANRTK